MAAAATASRLHTSKSSELQVAAAAAAATASQVELAALATSQGAAGMCCELAVWRGHKACVTRCVLLHLPLCVHLCALFRLCVCPMPYATVPYAVCGCALCGSGFALWAYVAMPYVAVSPPCPAPAPSLPCPRSLDWVKGDGGSPVGEGSGPPPLTTSSCPAVRTAWCTCGRRAGPWSACLGALRGTYGTPPAGQQTP